MLRERARDREIDDGSVDIPLLWICAMFNACLLPFVIYNLVRDCIRRRRRQQRARRAIRVQPTERSSCSSQAPAYLPAQQVRPSDLPPDFRRGHTIRRHGVSAHPLDTIPLLSPAGSPSHGHRQKQQHHSSRYPEQGSQPGVQRMQARLGRKESKQVAPTTKSEPELGCCIESTHSIQDSSAGGITGGSSGLPSPSAVTAALSVAASAFWTNYGASAVVAPSAGSTSEDATHMDMPPR